MPSLLALLADRRLAIFLLITLSIFLIISTTGKETARQLMPVAHLCFMFFSVNLAACTIKNFRLLRRGVILMHIGVLVTLAGRIFGGVSGFVATVNIHEGEDASTAFRWDLRQDMLLGFQLRVVGIEQEFYQIDAKIGILVAGEKKALLTLKQGETANFDRFQLVLEDVDAVRGTARLGILTNAPSPLRLGTCTTGAPCDISGSPPLTFQLVAFKTPVLRRLATTLRITDANGSLHEGVSMVNSPLTWNGIRFFTTQVALDDHGLPYAGIQITKDPGIAVVYAGFTFFLLGAVIELARGQGWRRQQ